MSYQPAHVADADPVMVGTYGKNSLAWTYHGFRAAAPASGGAGVASRVLYAPFFLNYGYSLERFWWQSGATVGTDNFQMGLYDENLARIASCAQTLSAGTVNQVQFAAATSAPVHLPPMRGWIAFWTNGTTATVFRKTNWAEAQPFTFHETGAGSGLPSTATFISNKGGGLPVINCGFTRSTSP